MDGNMMVITELISRATSLLNREASDHNSFLANVPFVKGIPKTVVQTCPDKGALPKEIIQNRARMSELNPLWTFELYDDSDIEKYILCNYGTQVYNYYKRIDDSYGAAKADFFRYLKIYKDGGVYIDIKSSINLPLDDTIHEDDSLILSFWGCKADGYKRVHHAALPDYMKEGEVAQWYLIAAPGHPFIRALIMEVMRRMDRYNPYIDGVGWTGTVCTTGPAVYSSIMYKLARPQECTSDYRWANIIDDFGFRYSIYDSIKNDSVFHAKAIKSDYRKGIKPVIRHRIKAMNAINCMYLKLINKQSSKNQ